MESQQVFTHKCSHDFVSIVTTGSGESSWLRTAGEPELGFKDSESKVQVSCVQNCMTQQIQRPPEGFAANLGVFKLLLPDSVTHLWAHTWGLLGGGATRLTLVAIANFQPPKLLTG